MFTRAKAPRLPILRFRLMSKQLPKHDPYAALRVRDFRFLIASRFLVSIAFQIVDVALAWQVFSLTKEPLSLGLVGLAEAIPSIGISLYAGHLSDIKSRRAISLNTLF